MNAAINELFLAVIGIGFKSGYLNHEGRERLLKANDLLRPTIAAI